MAMATLGREIDMILDNGKRTTLSTSPKTSSQIGKCHDNICTRNIIAVSDTEI